MQPILDNQRNKKIKKRPDQIEKIRRAHRREIAIRCGWIALLILAFVCIYRVVRPGPAQPKPVVSGTNQQEIALEQLLLTGTTQEIIKKAKEFKVSGNLPIPLRLQRINNRMKIAQGLLKRNDDPVAQKHGTLFKIESLHQLAKLNNANSLGVKDAAEELSALVADSLNSPDPEIAKVARVSVMLNRIQDFLEHRSEENRVQAIEECRQVAEDLPEDREIATAIFQIARVMKNAQGYTMDAVDFFNIVYDVYIRSDILLTKQIGIRSYEEIIFGDNNLAELKESAITRRGNAARDISKRLEYGLNNPELRLDEAQQLFSILDVLIQSGELDLVRANLGQISGFIESNPENENLDLIQKFFSVAQKQFDQIGKRLDLAALLAIDGQTSIALETDTAARLVVFWSPDNLQSRAVLAEIDRLPPKLRDRTQVIAICNTHESVSEKQESVVNEMSEMSQLFSEFIFASISTNPDSGSVLDEQLPVTKMPFLILLDRDDVVHAVNPSMLTIRSQIREILESRSGD